MKRNLTLLILLIFTSCSFDTKGPKITEYNAPQKALLVIDIQRDFTGSDAKMPVDKKQAIEMIATANTLIKNRKKLSLNIIYITNEFSSSDTIANWFRNSAAIEGTKGTELDPGLNRINTVKFIKKESDAFSSAKLNQYLIKNQINELYLVGLFADQCVYWTAKGALNRGYKTTVIEDGVATKSDIKKINTLKKYKENNIKVVPHTVLLQ